MQRIPERPAVVGGALLGPRHKARGGIGVATCVVSIRAGRPERTAHPTPTRSASPYEGKREEFNACRHAPQVIRSTKRLERVGDDDELACLRSSRTSYISTRRTDRTPVAR